MPDAEGYFAALGELLRETGAGMPRLVIDLDRVERNVERLCQLQPTRSIRIVAKSLPCPALLQHIVSVTGEEKFMVFHLPFLLQIVERFPDADILMGKPMPVAAARRFYEDRRNNAFDDSRQLQWLVDTDDRLRELASLATELGRRIRVNIEVDVGMHRGGASGEGAFESMLATCAELTGAIELAGFMGYDAHVPKAPWPHSVGRSAARARDRFAGFVDIARNRYAALEENSWCINGAGSPTVAMHGDSSPLNEVSTGSVLVKPSGFDLPTLEEFEPAAWIATPVLKRSPGVRIPYIEGMPSRGRDTLFIYGGKWMATPCYPDGIRENPTYGLSSNQQMLTVPSTSTVAVDDYVYLRPTQSEAVLLQFGDLCVVRKGALVDNWPVFRNEGYPARPVQ